jgi:hypothetical protein
MLHAAFTSSLRIVVYPTSITKSRSKLDSSPSIITLYLLPPLRVTETKTSCEHKLKRLLLAKVHKWLAHTQQRPAIIPPLSLSNQ